MGGPRGSANAQTLALFSKIDNLKMTEMFHGSGSPLFFPS
jgi:hypothetical protein